MRRLTFGWMAVGLVAALVPALSFLSPSMLVDAQGPDPADPEYAAAYAHRYHLRTSQHLADEGLYPPGSRPCLER